MHCFLTGFDGLGWVISLATGGEFSGGGMGQVAYGLKYRVGWWPY